MNDTPEVIYLIRGEDDEFGPTHVWCDDPAPDEHCDPSEAVEYVRKDKYDERVGELEAAIKYASDYLGDSQLNAIGHGSKAHREMKSALNESVEKLGGGNA